MFKPVHQACNARLSSDRPGQENGGDSTWIAPFFFSSKRFPWEAGYSVPALPPLSLLSGTEQYATRGDHARHRRWKFVHPLAADRSVPLTTSFGRSLVRCNRLGGSRCKTSASDLGGPCFCSRIVAVGPPAGQRRDKNSPAVCL